MAKIACPECHKRMNMPTAAGVYRCKCGQKIKVSPQQIESVKTRDAVLIEDEPSTGLRMFRQGCLTSIVLVLLGAIAIGLASQINYAEAGYVRGEAAQSNLQAITSILWLTAVVSTIYSFVGLLLWGVRRLTS